MTYLRNALYRFWVETKHLDIHYRGHVFDLKLWNLKEIISKDKFNKILNEQFSNQNGLSLGPPGSAHKYGSIGVDGISYMLHVCVVSLTHSYAMKILIVKHLQS